MATTKKDRPIPLRRVRTYVRHILAAYARCSPEQRTAGIEWYAAAKAYAVRMGALYSFPVDRVAYAIAALSPAVSWVEQTRRGGNVETVLAHVADGAAGLPRCAGYTKNRLKAVRILNGDFSALSGPKVTAFAANILGAGERVTVDRHAAAIAANLSRSAKGGTGNVSIGIVAMRRIAAAYVDAARAIGLRPCELQAAVWLERNRKKS